MSEEEIKGKRYGAVTRSSAKRGDKNENAEEQKQAESNKSLQQIIQLLTHKIQADEITQKEPKVTADNFAKIVPDFDGVSIPVEIWLENFEQNADAYDLTEKQRCAQARGKMVKMVKLFLESELYQPMIESMIAEYKPAENNTECPVSMKIVLEERTKPFRHQPSRHSAVESESFRKQVDVCLQDGIERKSSSNFASLVVVVKKKDGTDRICVDFRQLNSMVLKDCFPVPRMDDVLEQLQPANVFVVMDLENSFLHEAIEQMEPAEAQRNTRFEIEELFIHAKVCVQEQLGPDANSTGIHESTVNFGHTSAVKLPRLSLPTFDGKYCEYQNFILSFNQVIGHQPSMSKIEKFNQLLNCLRGPALETVRAFQVTADNYTKALDRLMQRYDNPTFVFLDNISSLFALPTVAKSNGQQLRSLIDNASALYNSLRSLSTEPQICEAMLISIVMGKVDQETKRKWNESLDYTTLPSWDKCVGVVERHCQYLESDKKPPAEAPMSQPGGHRSRSQRNQASLSFNCTTQTCNICSQTDHKTFRCPQLINLALDNRLNAVKRYKLCINCLGRGHLVANCPSTRRCHSCALPHHSLLHRPSPGSAAAPLPLPQAEPVQVSDPVAHTHTESRSDCVILATALILVKDASGSYKIGRALLDSCSQVNFISEEFAQRLRLPRSKLDLEIRSIGETQTRIKHHATTNIKSRHNGFELLLDFCVTSHIAYHPESEIDISAWNLPQHSSLADESFNKSRQIDLLLGTETFFDILAVGQVKLGKDLPVLQKTLLGWIVSGRCRAHPRTLHQYSSIALTEIDQKMERLWRIDHVELPEITLTPEQRNCEEFYTKTLRRNSDGRLEVRLPFKDEPTVLGASFDIAKMRFLSLERSLCKRPEVGAKYVEFMQEFQNLGHMSPVSHPQLNTPHYYIPHHCVLKPNSTSTKLRVVFDASCKTTCQKSLNDILMVGPTILPDLYTLLLRFRIHRYAITADVVKMFRQVNMFAEERTSPLQPLSTFELNTVTYGTAAAPYLAIRSLSYLADKFMDKLEIGAKAIKSSFYVDDFLGGADTVEELHQIKREVTAILQDGQLKLAKWHLNHCKFVDDATVKHLQLDDEMLTSTLGLKWDQVRDTFMFSFSPRFDSDHVTKRSILSIASSLFDPLGLVTPIIIVAKIILQELWLLKLHWDESVPQGIHTAWMSLLASLSSLESVAIPRYCLQSAIHTFQIHGFCDASIRAYGCCIYARTIGSDGLTKVQLITSKSRVAPTKKLSLPKLELCGAHLLAQLYKTIIRIFADRKPTSFLWCDSQIVLHWNRQHSATLSTFVGNRIAEIQELTSDCHWRHVPTHCNPADILSRGCTITELEQSIWFEGPEFLGQDHQHWPKDSRDNSDIDMETVQLEKRKSAFAVHTTSNQLLEGIYKISSHHRCLLVIAWMYRFIQRCQMSSVLKGHPIRTNLKNLSLFLQVTDGFQMLKVGGRLELADYPKTQKHPVLLPAKDPFVSQFARHLHLQNYHAGPRTLVALIRKQFWIVNARDLARQVVRSCIHCRRYRPTLERQLMGQLPKERITPSRSFSRCGIDFCGPINVYLRIRGKPPTKAYLTVFVCFATKAIHVEVVLDLTTDSFIASLKRFIARRGLPSDIFCDNATNFAGTNNKLESLKQFLFKDETTKTIHYFCRSEFISFHFIPPRAPHFGGIWEAAVKSVKGLLNRTLRDTRLTFEELATAAADVEAILNSRPLTQLSSDPNDLAALTPGHFLVGDALRALPELPPIDDNLDKLDRWKRVSALKHHIWSRWSHEYINELQVRTTWTKTSPNLAVNDMVIVHEDNLPPQRLAESLESAARELRSVLANYGLRDTESDEDTFPKGSLQLGDAGPPHGDEFDPFTEGVKEH
ncbi:uncharacterized protein LOC122756477 [Drosophila santomea]|uniref:uncharacterized protein LOC122756477 n=1 Tax=Drosophila santomea TaxID=129105 RepID=UPI001CCDF13A|nr:uncharacterized protein LOC122756477 [Drosophila santomea]